MIKPFSPKDPNEVDFFNLDFTNRLPVGDSVASLVTLFVAVGDSSLVVDQAALSGNIVSGRWSGGTLGETYTITARVTTTQGRTLDLSGTVEIDES